jgi:butyryl-CoA dehydrogenase
MGFIEETGVAQLYRDARILTIYEGTTAIQANDLVGRKTARDGGAVARAFIDKMTLTGRAAAGSADPDLRALAPRLATAIAAYGAVVDFVVGGYRTDLRAVHAGAVPYLMLAGLVHGGWQMTRAALAARRALDEGGGDGAFLHAKIATARFFADHFLVGAPALQASIVDGAAATLALGADDF